MDISERSIVEKKIEELKKVVDYLPNAVIIHTLPDFKVLYMSPLGLKLLNQNIDEIEGMTADEYHEKYFNKSDADYYLPKISELLKKNTDDSVSFFQQVKTSRVPSRYWDWYLSSIKIFARNKKDQPLATITTAQQIDPEHFFTKKAVRFLKENEFLKKNISKYSSLTSRETEVFKRVALGKTVPEIAEELVISVKTAQTHRKNMKRKLGLSNNYDLALYAKALDII